MPISAACILTKQQMSAKNSSNNQKVQQSGATKNNHSRHKTMKDMVLQNMKQLDVCLDPPTMSTEQHVSQPTCSSTNLMQYQKGP